MLCFIYIAKQYIESYKKRPSGFFYKARPRLALFLKEKENYGYKKY